MAEKMTKKDYFEQIKTILTDPEEEGRDGIEELVAFVDKEITAIETKAVKAKMRAEKAKEKGDALREDVFEALTEDLQVIEEIFEQVETEGITKAMVTARLTQLVKAGKAEKELVKIEGSTRKIMAYKLAEAETVE